MNREGKDLNPFRNAKTKEEKETVWKSLRPLSKRISKEEAERLIKEAIRLQQLKR